jgi:purine-binding chemotaxis protein CheW
MQTDIVNESPTQPRAFTARGREYLSFELGAEQYGFDIFEVQEIRAYEQATRVANAPAFVRGLMNLRGAIVPIVDLRLRFGVGAAQYGPSTVMIVLNVAGRVVALVVDAVSDVLALEADQVCEPSGLHPVIDNGSVVAVGRTDERTVYLLDGERLLASPDMALVG